MYGHSLLVILVFFLLLLTWGLLRRMHQLRRERNRQLHLALAETYNALGRPELAAGHARLAE